MLFIGGVEKRIITLTFIAGLAYMLTFIYCVAPIAKYTTSQDDPFWNGMYVMTQQVSWWGAAAWAMFIFAVLKKKSWAIPIGIFAGTMFMLAGYPLGLHNALAGDLSATAVHPQNARNVERGGVNSGGWRNIRYAPSIGDVL